MTSPREFGVYVHIPFCSRRCDYCAFATWTDRAELMSAYVDACLGDVRAAALSPATSVFFGGGTPSLLPAVDLAAIVAAIDTAPNAEVTVECNPENVTRDLLDAYLAAGVTRISLGVQSMLPHVLACLGRHHEPESAARAADLVASAGFASWSVDLIFGAVGESTGDWAATLEAAIAFGSPHLSAYALTVEGGTPLATDPSRAPDDDDQADKYLAANDALERAGLACYEVSNWAVPGHECQHNLLYWTQGNYLGIGCAAHSHTDGRRWWNVRTPERYIERISAGLSPEAASESLEPEERRMEALQLTLRTMAGVPRTAFDPEDLDDFEEFLVRNGEHVVLTPRGRLMGNEIAIRLR